MLHQDRRWCDGAPAWGRLGYACPAQHVLSSSDKPDRCSRPWWRQVCTTAWRWV